MASESRGCGSAAGHPASWGAELGDFRPAPCEEKKSPKMQHFAESMASSVEPTDIPDWDTGGGRTDWKKEAGLSQDK